MKKSIVIAILLMLVFLSACSDKDNSLEFDRNYVDNSYNNTLVGAGEIARHDNRIFYSYQPEGERIKNGVYEISENGFSKIYYPTLFEINEPIELHMQYSENLVLVDLINYVPLGVEVDYEHNHENNFIVKLDTAKNSFDQIIFFENFEQPIDYYYLVNDDFYFVSNGYIYDYSNGKYSKLLDVNKIYGYEQYGFSTCTGFNGWYVDNGQIYFFSSEDKSFCAYNIENKQTKVIIDEDGLKNGIGLNCFEEIDNLFLVNKNMVVFTVFDSFSDNKTTFKYFCFDINNLKFNFLAENLYSDCFSVNMHDDYLYLGSDILGLRSVNLVDKKITQLSEKSSVSISVLDDKYIYFVDENKSLYRVDINDKKTEMIFRV